MTKKLLLRRKFWHLVHTAFAIAFLIQSCHIILELIRPTESTINVEKVPLKELPVILKICIIPAFDINLLEEEGYNSTSQYIKGILQFPKMGWGGKNRRNVRDVYNSVRRQKALGHI